VGADAVIYVRYEIRSAVAQGFLGAKGVFEVYAFGTAVKFRD
jgi:uncharacterized protein YbjQ (UPF0145 family)